MPTNGPLEALQKWREVSQWLVTSWSTQTKAVVTAPDPDTQSTAVRDAVALAVTSGVQVAATALGTIALLTEPSDATTYAEYSTAASEGVRTLALEDDLLASTDASCKVVKTDVLLRPTTLADGEQVFVISCTTKGLNADEYAGTVCVLNSAGAEIERIAVSLLV